MAFVTLQDKQGVKMPYFRFYTNKGGGVDAVFSTYNALWELYKSQQPVDFAAKPTPAPKAPKKPVVTDLQTALWKAKQVDLWASEYANASDEVSESFYLQRKFRAFVPARPFFEHTGVFGSDDDRLVDVVALASSAANAAGVKFGTDKLGNFLIIRMQAANGRVVGYQKIYDTVVNFGDSGYRDKDYRFLDAAKQGSFVRIGSLGAFDDYVFVCEGFATGLAVFIATGKPVFVAGDANNLAHVLQAVKGLGYKRAVIAADNDVLGKGNTGVFCALKASKAHTARIFVAQLDGKKADFNDVLLALGLDALKSQLVFRMNANEVVPERNVFEGAVQLLGVCQQNQLKKHVWFCCSNAVANQLEMSLDDAEKAICQALVTRGVAVDAVRDDVSKAMKKALWYAIKRCKSKNTACFADFARVVDCTGRSNESIAAEIMASKGIWLDNRAMGVGKTELMGAVLGLAVSRHLSCAYLCHRQSLVANSSDRIKAISYKDLNSGSETMVESAIALCVNSIINPRFCSFVTQFSNVIFIDEIRQTLEHVAIGSINGSERKLVYEALIAAIRNAEYVLGSDADLNQLTVDWLKHNFPEKAFFGLTCQAKNPTPVIEYGHYVAAFNAAVKSALSGVPTLIQCDSIKASKAVFQAVNQPHLKVLLVNSENKADANQARFLLTPNDEIKHYDVVIHSPVIGSGVSITCGYVQAHFALFRGVLAENEVLQMIGRNRNSKTIVVGFNDKHVKNRVNSAATLRDGEVKARERVYDGEIITDPIDNLRMKIIARHNDSLNDFAVQSLLLMRFKGYQMRRFEGDESIEELAIARKDARVVHCDGVLSAVDISAPDAYKLEKAESLTQEESYQLEKFEIQHGFALPSVGDVFGLPSMVADDVVFFDSGRIMKTIHNREIAEATREQRLEVDTNGKGFKSVAKGFHIDVLLGIMKGVAMDQYHAVGVAEYLQKNHAELGALGLGNYSKVSKYPVRVVNGFLEHFGYKLVGRKVSAGAKKGDRVYTLRSHEKIDEIVGRRTVQNVFKSVTKVADGDLI